MRVSRKTVFLVWMFKQRGYVGCYTLNSKLLPVSFDSHGLRKRKPDESLHGRGMRYELLKGWMCCNRPAFSSSTHCVFWLKQWALDTTSYAIAVCTHRDQTVFMVRSCHFPSHTPSLRWDLYRSLTKASPHTGKEIVAGRSQR